MNHKVAIVPFHEPVKTSQAGKYIVHIKCLTSPKEYARFGSEFSYYLLKIK